MIHQVQESRDDSALLRELVELQLQLLQFGAAHPGVDCKDLEQYFVETYGANASEVVGWVFRHSKLIDNLKLFASHPDGAEKLTLVQQMRSDVDLLFNPAAQKLQVSFSGSSGNRGDPDWKCAAGVFCRHFYTIWGYSDPPGFPDYLFARTSIAGQRYTRWDFINHFLEANHELYLCTMCDATAFHPQLDTRAHTGIEHFFPKSIYPHLGMHPKNLIPICTYCNSIKNDDDLMQLCGEAMGIQELLLPYQSDLPGFDEMAYVDVAPRAARTNGMHPLEIKLKPASDFSSTAPLIRNFESLYHVEARWNTGLDQIGEQVFRRIQQFLMADVQMGNDLSDLDFMIERLELLMALTSMSNIGRDPYGMATVWMLKYHIDSLRRDKAAALIYCNLVNWAIDHRETWEGLRNHVQKLYDRIPDGDRAIQPNGHGLPDSGQDA